MSWRRYYYLTKPGIIYGNVLTTVAGYLYASRWHIELTTLSAVLIGTSLVIAGACVYNNCIDRRIDMKMARTRRRALVTGTVSLQMALTYATVLTVAGFAILALKTNLPVVLVGIIGFIDYVLLYTWAKRSTAWGTVIGSISGATPVVAGYVSVTSQFDGTAAVLFAILALWQMPHFYAIALYRRADYAAASIPVLAVTRSFQRVRRTIIGYILAFGACCVGLSFLGGGAWTFGIAMGLLTLAWLTTTGVHADQVDPAAWGRRVFLMSLVVMSGLAGLLSVASILP